MSDSSREEWQKHPYTEVIRKDAERCASEALQKLLNHCKTTQDPKVLEMYYRWSMFETLKKLAKTGEVAQ